MLLAAT